MKKHVIVVTLLSLSACWAGAATCTKDNEGEQVCQAGTVMVCGRANPTSFSDMSYKWKPLSIYGNDMGPSQKCDSSNTSNHTAGGGNSNNDDKDGTKNSGSDKRRK